MLNVAIIIAALLTGAILFWPKVSNNKMWRAIVTPLASIIGSGFLVLGPILSVHYGKYAPFVMLSLCIVSFAFGRAIRFNILAIDQDRDRTKLAERLEQIASWALAFAYIISVAYYLNLFGAFAVSELPIDSKTMARGVTSAVFVVILAVGWLKGLSALERMEQISVTIKLAIIAALLLGLAVFFGQKVSSHELVGNPLTTTGWKAITYGFGLIVTVQGFETSRYLTNRYDARTRVRSMRSAQFISAAIYMIYIVLIAYVFTASRYDLDETTIIHMMDVVAPILPLMLIAAALSAQFSAAVADTGGSGGLFEEVTGGKIPEKWAYVLLVGIGLLLTWTLNVFAIISYASRAFAAYYGLQSAIAAATAWQQKRRLSAALFASLVLLAFAITLFGQPVE